MAEFLPISKSDMKRRGWAQCDFVYIIGDAYVDHPSFGHAIISRVLEDAGYKVGIISQPDWKNPGVGLGAGEAAPRLPCDGREHGLDGEPLCRLQAAPGRPTPTRRAA